LLWLIDQLLLVQWLVAQSDKVGPAAELEINDYSEEIFFHFNNNPNADIVQCAV